ESLVDDLLTVRQDARVGLEHRGEVLRAIGDVRVMYVEDQRAVLEQLELREPVLLRIVDALVRLDRRLDRGRARLRLLQRELDAGLGLACIERLRAPVVRT